MNTALPTTASQVRRDLTVDRHNSIYYRDSRCVGKVGGLGNRCAWLYGSGYFVESTSRDAAVDAIAAEIATQINRDNWW